MKTADRENPNSRAWLCNKPSPWGGRQETPSLNHAGWKLRNVPAEGKVFFLTFPFIELHRTNSYQRQIMTENGYEEA
jgi:hypothetical protein